VFQVFRYQTSDGQEPLTAWLVSLRDKQAQAKLRIRLKRLQAGLFGDCESVGDGVFELREHLGAGSKKTQTADIRAAKAYWADWKRRQV
jgi:putative component of toxin-antitoxin plasmid stabilization module